MVAVALIFGRLVAADYEDDIAADPRIDALRADMEVLENKGFTTSYFDSERRYIGNALQVYFKDGSSTERVEVEFPIGHQKRRDEGIPMLVEKFEQSAAEQLDAGQCQALNDLFADPQRLSRIAVSDFMAMMVKA